MISFSRASYVSVNGTSVDPVGGEASSAQSWNRNAYVQNSPVSFNDPDGERRNPVTGGEGIDEQPVRGQIGRISRSAGNPRSGSFGWTRRDGNGKKKFHSGTDIMAPEGTPIVAAEAGTVLIAKSVRGFGNTVVLKHADGCRTLYAHLEVIAPYVTSGTVVGEGDLLGLAGTTGNAATKDPTQEHLHFGVRGPDKKRVDPVLWLNNPFALIPRSSSTNITPAQTSRQLTLFGGSASESGCGVNMSCMTGRQIRQPESQHEQSRNQNPS